ncbi:MAG: YdbH domain-containing protein [Sphingomonas sp.]|nr:YdbH domain-containing protein [Sphingomonas sp.]
MDNSRPQSGEAGASEEAHVRRHRVRRAVLWVLAALLLILVAALVIVWVERRSIASNIMDNELDKRGVRTTYTLDRVGLRTQQISNLVVGDPRNPDVVAKRVLIQMRLKWNGSVDVYRIVARGLRLRGTVRPGGQVSWGELDKLLPPPSGQPFSLPDVAVDIADSSIALRTPWGPLGFAVSGDGNLRGGFKGRFVSSSPQLITGRCIVEAVRGSGAIEIMARKPHIVGPLSASRFACPSSRFSVIQPRLEIDSRFSEAFGEFDARARILSQVLTAGDNGLAAMNGTMTFKGTPEQARGEINLTAQKSRMGTIAAERTRVTGKYRLGASSGTLVMAGHYNATDASLAPSMIAAFTNGLAATKSTPIGEIAGRMSKAISQSASRFNASGGLALVNFPGGGAARVIDATVQTSTGGRASIAGGKGLTYFWPSGVIRVDGTIRTVGGGLPESVLVLRQRRDGGLDGVGNFRPYVVDGSRLALGTLRFNAQPDGATAFSTVARLDGRFPGGVVRALNLPISGRMGSTTGIEVGRECMVVSFDYLRMKQFQLGRTRLPICPTGPAIISQAPGGPLRVAGRINGLALAGTVGGSPVSLNSSNVLLSQTGFNATNAALRLGKSATSPVVVNAANIRGTFAGGGASGTLSGADAVVGTVPVTMSEMDGRWRFTDAGALTVDGGMLVSDRSDPAKFYPLRSNDARFTMVDNRITATAGLRHPDSGTLVTNLSMNHNLSSGAGEATLDVPGIAFGPGLQPDELTPVTEGVVALVNGVLRGQGRINWSGGGKITSTGDFSTANMSLAAPFGPVTGLTTSLHFTDLLGLETAPGQVAAIRSMNPGIQVDNGVIRYQLLRDQLVKVERGEWPFMGGRLILEETVLNFGAPSQKRLTFRVEGFNADTFVDTLGFPGVEITGIFDGVLPMIFDESGGRIVGGRLDSRLPGGRLTYVGATPKLGLPARLALQLLTDLRYRSLIVRLDGDLAGEFGTRLTFDQVALGEGRVAGLLRSVNRVPFKLNLSINGPFRALINMSKGFRDPTQVIAPVLPFPIDSPSLNVTTRRIEKQTEQTQTPPAKTEQRPQTTP